MANSAKHQVFGSPGLPPEPAWPPKPIPRPRWETLARLVEGTQIRKPLPWSGRWQIGGRYQRLADGSEFDAMLEVSGDVLATAERLRSAFLLGGERELENHLAALRKTASDDVSRMYINDVERTLKLLLGAGDEVRNG